LGLAIVGAPVGGYLADRWRKRNVKARLLFPTFSTFLARVFYLSHCFCHRFVPIYSLIGVLVFVITMFVSAAAAVTQDVIHAGLWAASYAIAVLFKTCSAHQWHRL
jgi:MFS family permease